MKEFPNFIFIARSKILTPGVSMLMSGNPALVIKGSITKYLKILGFPDLSSFSFTKGAKERLTVQGPLLHTIHFIGHTNAGCFKYGRDHINEMQKMGAHRPLIFNHLWPAYHHGIATATEVRCHLLHPGERSIPGKSPAYGEVRLGFRTANFIGFSQVFLNGTGDAIQGLHLVYGSL